MERITIAVEIKASLEKVWNSFIDEQSIEYWNHASEDWHCPKAVNNFYEGEHFSYTMAARDGSASFDLRGTYIKIVPKQLIYYALNDGRQVEVLFEHVGEYVQVIQSFDPESVHPREMQKEGWQAILNNFKCYVETHA